MRSTGHGNTLPRYPLQRAREQHRGVLAQRPSAARACLFSKPVRAHAPRRRHPRAAAGAALNPMSASGGKTTECARGRASKDVLRRYASSATISFLKTSLHSLVTFALSDEAGLLPRMRATCGLTAAEETALNQLAERHKAECERALQELPQETEACNALQQHAAAADAARHGLRRCALPACGAQEPHPKLFKLCGRCRSAAYCCAQHSKEDWKRHKREDGCKAAA